MKTSALIFCLMLSVAHAQFIQQGNKLFGTGATGNANQGISVAVSADGNTALVGGYNDNTGRGAGWIFVRNANGVWRQQGAKLVGSPATGSTNQGYSVGLSGDGNTAIIGSPGDAGIGAAWIFVRTDTVWTQQAKLVGTSGGGGQGISVAISADGNTAILGGYFDGAMVGAVWIFTRNGSLWTQQGTKLVGSGAVGNSQQGISVALSANGNTAIWGGWWDNAQAGAAWVFTRTDTVWSQQGSKLVGTGAVGSGVFQGNSVSISADGNTALVGGYADNAQAGATWVFTRSGGVWSQQGSKLVGTGGVGGGRQGQEVSLSSDGNTAFVTATYDNAQNGSAWFFTRTGSVWSQLGQKISGTGNVGQAQQGWSGALSGDGNTALLGGWRDNALGGATWVFTRGGATLTHNNLNKPILDNQNVFDTLLVSTNSPLASFVQDVNITIDTLLHPNLNDLELSLLHLGVNDTIVYRVGGSGDNFIGTILDDSAASPIAGGSPPFTGRFRPEHPLTQFNTLNANGAWILRVFDRATGNTGTLQAWSLTLRVIASPTSVEPVSLEVPKGLQLMQNFPNPFNPTTNINFRISDFGFVSLRVFDMLGREVAILVNEEMKPGNHDVTFDARGLSSGTYFYTLAADGFVQTKRLLLLK